MLDQRIFYEEIKMYNKTKNKIVSMRLKLTYISAKSLYLCDMFMYQGNTFV